VGLDSKAIRRIRSRSVAASKSPQTWARRVWCQGNLVGAHARIWVKPQTISDPEHVEAAKLMRRRRFDVVGPPLLLVVFYAVTGSGMAVKTPSGS
jgi:hypothetical protein